MAAVAAGAVVAGVVAFVFVEWLEVIRPSFPPGKADVIQAWLEEEGLALGHSR